MSVPRKTVFLDRDGVINRIREDFVKDWSEFTLLPGVITAIARLHQAGFRTVIVTNQRAIAAGVLTREGLAAIHRRLSQLVGRAGGLLEEFYYCPHAADAGCDCRKPNPGMLDQAAENKPVDWRASYIVGDMDKDVQAGRARGLTTIKVAGPSQTEPHHLCSDLPEAVDFILAHSQSVPG